MDEYKLIELLLRMTDEILILKGERKLESGSQEEYLNQLGCKIWQGEKDLLIREQHRVEFDRERGVTTLAK